MTFTRRTRTVTCTAMLVGICSHALAEDVQRPEPRNGVSISGFGAYFFGDAQSGPQTLLSETRYQDTFGTGAGLRFEGFHDFGPVLRGHIGFVYTRWPGKTFTGGEFPAGASFEEFSLAGLYVGAKIRFLEDARIHPFLLANLGVVRLSSVNVTAGGVTSPYWGSTYKDYLELGPGLGYSFTRQVAVYLDFRLALFGAPKSENPPVSDATGGSYLTVNIGLDLCLF